MKRLLALAICISVSLIGVSQAPYQYNNPTEGYNTPLVLQKIGGNVGIGTTDTKGYKLAVAGSAGIVAEKMVIKTQTNWPDYVFKSSYILPSLSSVETFIKKYNHLPDMASAQEVEDEGLDLAQSQKALLKKVEELTLYLIEQEKKIERLEKAVSNQIR